MASQMNDTIQSPTTHGIPAEKRPAQKTKAPKFNYAGIEEKEYSEQEYKDLASLYNQTFTNIHEGEIVKGRIVAITDNGVAIDIGFKSEGIVPLAEFPNIDELKPNDEVEVFLESVENKDGQLVLSRKHADFVRTWERVVRAFETGEVLQGKITRRIKGGLVVDLMGLDAFLPGSQIDVKPVRDFDQFLGKMMEFRVAKINHPNENVVVSHKVLIEA
jgi:small subunit ribosomal protein S1